MRLRPRSSRPRRRVGLANVSPLRHSVTACAKSTVSMKSFIYTPLQGGPPHSAYDRANELIDKRLAGTLDMHIRGGQSGYIRSCNRRSRFGRRDQAEVSAAGAGAKLGRPLEEPVLFTMAEKTARSRGKATRFSAIYSTLTCLRGAILKGHLPARAKKRELLAENPPPARAEKRDSLAENRAENPMAGQSARAG